LLSNTRVPYESLFQFMPEEFEIIFSAGRQWGRGTVCRRGIRAAQLYRYSEAEDQRTKRSRQLADVESPGIFHEQTVITDGASALRIKEGSGKFPFPLHTRSSGDPEDQGA
jgi:hypothetical protein